jgi:hypothetical protein
MNWFPNGEMRFKTRLRPRQSTSGSQADPDTFQPVDSAGRESIGGQNRTQRNTLALRNVAYVIHATPFLSQRANHPRLAPEGDDEEAGPILSPSTSACSSVVWPKGNASTAPIWAAGIRVSLWTGRWQRTAGRLD